MASPVTASAGSTKRRAAPAAPPLDTILDAIPCFAALARTDGTLVYCNDPLARACRWTDDVRRGRQLCELVSAADAQELLKGQDRVAIRAPLHPAQGPDLTVEWTARELLAPAGDRFICVTGRDVTRELELENHLVENQWFETAAALSGGLAHDFNNVLAAVLGLSEIIALRLPADSPLHDFTRKIGLSVERAKLLVRRFSQFSRKNAGGAEPIPTAMVLEELAKPISGFLPGSVTFALEVSSETPWCEADRYIVEQIVLNCANFLRSRLRTDTGAVTLSCRASKQDAMVLIDVRGSGQGLLGVNLESCFALDLQPTASAYESGSALYVARRLATHQGGSLLAVRHDPRTVSFVLELPAAK